MILQRFFVFSLLFFISRHLVFGPCGLDIWVHSLQMVVPLGPWDLRRWLCVYLFLDMFWNNWNIYILHNIFTYIHTYVYTHLCQVYRCIHLWDAILGTCFTWVLVTCGSDKHFKLDPANKTGEMRTLYNMHPDARSFIILMMWPFILLNRCGLPITVAIKIALPWIP